MLHVARPVARIVPLSANQWHPGSPLHPQDPKQTATTGDPCATATTTVPTSFHQSARLFRESFPVKESAPCFPPGEWLSSPFLANRLITHRILERFKGSCFV